MAGWAMENGKVTQIQLYPIALGMDRPRSQQGGPGLAGGEKTPQYLAGLSKPYGTEIRIKNSVGYIYLLCLNERAGNGLRKCFLRRPWNLTRKDPRKNKGRGVRMNRITEGNRMLFENLAEEIRTRHQAS